VESNVEDNGKPTITKNITYEEMMSKQYLENEHPEPVPGTMDALEELTESAPKIDLKQVHQLRMQGKTAKEIATSFGVSVSTAYRWLDDIKKNRPMWAQDWVRAKEVKE
jgi:DNA-directed RNA polymerase specialized sigma24 family protein